MFQEFVIKERAYLLMTYRGIAIFLIGPTSAMLIKPGYSFTNQWFSELGTGKYSYLLNLTLILTGLLTSSFYPITFYLLRQNGYSKIKSLIGIFLEVNSFIFLILVGIFNIENDPHNIHLFSATMFLISTSLSQLLLMSGFSWYICLHLPSSSEMDNKLSYISVVIAIVFGIFFMRSIVFEQFILQKLTMYLLILTVLYQSIKIWHSEELLNSPQYVNI